jgi:glucokinase
MLASAADGRLRLVAADIGGTHARFALATIAEGAVEQLGEPVVFKTADFQNFESAWAELERAAGPLPSAASIAVAGPVLGDRVPMTNGSWVLRPRELRSALRLDALTVLNDFAAVAHAVAHAPANELVHICGPDAPLPEHGTISIIGPGTGLGVAQLHRSAGGYHVQPTEGGHVGFAPQDEIDDEILAVLRALGGRVVNEHVVAGAAIVAIHRALGGRGLDERTIWERGIDGSDALARRSVERFCASLGAVVGDYALAHGATGVVLAGGIGQKLRDVLPRSEFGERFRAKPRYEAMMAAIPVKLIIHPQPGLYGAAAAFARENG